MRLSRLVLLLIFTYHFSAQSQSKYWVGFTDKNHNEYSLNSPSRYLSSRALERRIRQGIPIRNNDLPVSSAYLNAVKNVGELQVVYCSKWLNGAVISTSDTLITERLKAFEFVKQVKRLYSPKSFKKTLKSLTPQIEDSNSADLLESFDYGNSFNQINMLEGDHLHEIGLLGEGLQIAVMDAGFTDVDKLSVFQHIRDNDQILGTKDFVDGDDNAYHGSQHGTRVLSAMAAYEEGTLVGTSPDASFWLFRTEDGSSESLVEEYNWIAAAEFADSAGIDIINTSLGYTRFDDASQDHTYQDMDGNTAPISIGADIAASKGILVIVSAGNSGNNSWNYIGAPADADSALSIGAVDASGNYASFSSKGPSSDGRIKPDVTAQGAGTIVADLSGGASGGNGTSFSTPVICGLAACLWQCAPNLTNMEVIDYIKRSAHQYNQPDTLLGYGIPNFLLAHTLIQNEHNTAGLGVELYPNPANLFFDLTLTHNTCLLVDVLIFNSVGNTVYKEFDKLICPGDDSDYQLGNQLYSKSLYFIQISTRNGVSATTKIVLAN